MAHASLAFWTYAMSKGGDPGAVNSIRHEMIAVADEIANRANNNGYGISLTNKDYVWGSNGVLANYGMELLVSGSLLHNPRYNGSGARRSALPAGTEYVFVVVRHAGRRESVSPSAPPAQRRRYQR
ncbi:MAG: hypothetical protein WDO73_26280 [Ignavibacteriota bacterium]